MSTPAATYTPPVDQPPPLAGTERRYGGFWVRLAAYTMDGLIIGVGAIFIVVGWYALSGFDSPTSYGDMLTLALLVLSQLYHAYFVSSAKMATPGKRLCGLYVTDLEGHRLTFGRALWRNVAALFSYLTIYLGFVLAGVTKRKQALHDMLAGTLVHRQPGSSAGLVIGIIVALFLAVLIVAILAAIALPAFHDYTFRARVAGVLAEVSAVREPIEHYAAEKGGWPTTWEQVESAGGSNPLRRLSPQSREIVEDVRLEKNGVVVTIVRIYGKEGQFRLTPRPEGDAIVWTCSASPEIRKFAPAACRQ